MIKQGRKVLLCLIQTPMKKILITITCVLLVTYSFAQHKTKNLIVVTLDGMRWQEVYRGADSALINSKYTTDKDEVRKNIGCDQSGSAVNYCSRFYGR